MPAEPPTPPPPGQELAREQAWLAHAREQLARMRARAEAMRDTATGGDRVSSEFLALRLHERVGTLVDDPRSTLFFGALVFGHEIEGHERWYIGRRHISDAAGDPVVIDWRAELSGAFYRASRTDPMDVVLRRRFGADQGRLTAYEDERLTAAANTEPDAGPDATHSGRSAILAAEIERPRVGPMRDIVATIQPEQDEIVRSDLRLSLCVQGAPGTGKTAVGLHRAAWLLYAHRDRLSRSGVLVVGPNTAFLDHIGAVLPALGEVEVRHTTAAGLVASTPALARVTVRAIDDTARATLKGDIRMAQVLYAALWARVGDPSEALVVPRGARRWRVPASAIREVIGQLRERQVSYAAARTMLGQRLAHLVLLEMERAGDAPDDRVQDAVARSAPVRAYIGALWPLPTPVQVLAGLYSDPAALSAAADSILDPAEQRLLLWPTPPRSPGTARWTLADLVLLDELADLIDRTPSLGHVILDEAQDLSPMQLRAVGRRAATGSVTVLGDIAQGTTPWATTSWEETLEHLGKPGAQVEVLDRGFRVPAAVIEYAARLLPHMAPGLGVPQSVRENPGVLDVVAVPPPGLGPADSGGAGQPPLPAVVTAKVRQAAARPGSVGVICADTVVTDVSAALTRAGIEHGVLGADHGDVEHQVDVVPATVAKGLEFDRVIVVEPAAIAAAEPDHRTGLRRLYVVLTRAVSELVVVHAEPLPPELAS